MTSLSLSLWIAAGIALQLAIGLGIGFWRHWRHYRSLRASGVETEAPATQADITVAEETDSPGWQGFRTFRVDMNGQSVSKRISGIFFRIRISQPMWSHWKTPFQWTIRN